ncbi:MAG: hypothetical protein OHK0039_34830 [Bacteroidia bacterium]
MKALLLCGLLLAGTCLQAQPRLDYNQPFVCTSQLGFRPGSEKTATLYGGNRRADLPDEIPFYIQPIGNRQPRVQAVPRAWEVPGNVFRYPIDIDQGPWATTGGDDRNFAGGSRYQGVLRRTETRWGVLWRGDFSDFTETGFYQIETEYGFTVPFVIEDHPYERLERGYLLSLQAQRSGVEVPGVRPVENADDARFDVDESRYLPVAGGWNDAGDHRKWLFLTLPNIEALAQIARRGHPAFREQALAELRWGNAYFHQMIGDEGQVYEDVGGGIHRGKADRSDWWNENHPGVTAAGDHGVDSIPMNGNERHVRSTYNPLVQLQFVRYQAIAARVLPPPDRSNCLVLAHRAWRYYLAHPHDGRTLFLAQALLAALELRAAGGPPVPDTLLRTQVQALLARQVRRPAGLSGYFAEADGEGYRSIAFSAEPALALLRLAELNPPALAAEVAQARAALRSYVEDFLLADAASNPFGLTPYGVYRTRPYEAAQTFRPAGPGMGVRTFIHLFGDRPMPHGCGAVHLSHGYLLARAAALLGEPGWTQAAERILQWTMGHNPAGLCLNSSVGFRHPVPANFVNYRIPDAVVVGFLGHPDDTPYLETSHAIEWSTQEIWDVPYYYTIGLTSYLR